MIKRVVIAAPSSGSGKTGVILALLESLKRQNKKTVSFKCGPDYIDPLFHKKVLDVDSFNLDTFFTDEETTAGLFLENSEGYEYSVIEGVMGLYDGLGGIREEGSTYHLAQTLKAPIILVVDAKGMGKSVSALIRGFKDFDKDNLIKGVILNRMSLSFYESVSAIIEKENDIKVLGFIRERQDIGISSRHLGLVTPDAVEGINEIICNLCDEFEEHVSLNEIQKIFDASCSEQIETIKDCRRNKPNESDSIFVAQKSESEIDDSKCVIAVAKDDAFCFLYEENIRELEKNGAAIEYFSPIEDKAVPESADALLFPGGYPELFLEKLSSNKEMINSIRKAYENKMPIVAECGGFMYLQKFISDKDGNKKEMAGIIDSECVYTGKSVRFGYIEITEKNASFLSEGTCIKGHEFHYYESTNNGDSCTARKPTTGKEYDCIVKTDSCWMGYPHLYYPSNPSFAQNFVKKAFEYRNNR